MTALVESRIQVLPIHFLANRLRAVRFSPDAGCADSQWRSWRWTA